MEVNEYKKMQHLGKNNLRTLLRGVKELAMVRSSGWSGEASPRRKARKHGSKKKPH